MMKFRTDDLLAQARLNEKESSVSAADKIFAEESKAVKVFSKLEEMLLTVDEWNRHSMLSSYKLFDARGHEAKENCFYVGAFLRISLKGTVKYDWVKVTEIYQAADEFILTVKPTFDPTAENQDKTLISHFFTDEAANNFCLVRKQKTVALYVIGLHEKMNTDETGNSLETIRNAAVNLGSFFGIQEGEWEKFCHHLLEDAVKNEK